MCYKVFAFLLLFVVPLSLMAAGVPVAPITGQAGAIEDVELYWIAFSGDWDSDPIYVMQIDSLGNVTRAPKIVAAAARFGSETGAIALAKNGTTKLNLWHFGRFNALYRIILNQSTLTPAGFAKIPKVVCTDDDSLQVTQKATSNFLVTEVPGRILKAFGLQTNGLVTTQTWSLSPTAPTVNDEGSIAADGMAATTNRNNPDIPTPPPDKLYVQMLASTGHPTGAPKLIATFKDIEASDITSALEGGKRFVVFITDKGTLPENKLFLQAVGPDGGKQGARILLNTPPTRDQDDQNLAIDPLGRFVVFTIGGNNFGCAGRDILVYQALNPTGHKVGSLKPLAKCGFVKGDIINIDMAKQ